MTVPSRRSFLLAGLLATGLIAAAPAAAPEPNVFAGVARIVAVGDVHGGFTELVGVLRTAGVIDSKNKWIGGRTHLVQTGDVLDRGADSRKVMDLLMQLEKPAQRAGGRVHAILGNHEAMNLAGDLRYVSPGEYAAFVTPHSEELRTSAFKLLAPPDKLQDPVFRGQFDEAYPIGWVEHRQAFGTQGKYGKWLRARPALVRIDGFLFLHGGISPTYVAAPMNELNQRITTELAGVEIPDGLWSSPDGPLWYRGLAREPEDTLAAHVDQVLQTHGVSHVVIGHTTTPGGAVPRFGGKVIMIDVGLGPFYGSRPVCLVIEKGVPYALHRGSRLKLPVGPGDDLVGYLRKAAALDPPPSPLEPLIEAGGRLPLPETTEQEPPR